MLKRLFLFIALIIAAFCVVAATRPADFKISRSAVLPAPPATVFAQVNDLQRWNDWSPWAKLDPNVKNTFEGPQAGVGATLSWAGNSEVGEGKMTITESAPSERVVMALEFYKPMPGKSTTEFTFKPEGNGTAMTWTMSGKNNFVGKCVGLVMDCDKMVGGQFEKGLENLRAVVAKPPQS